MEPDCQGELPEGFLLLSPFNLIYCQGEPSVFNNYNLWPAYDCSALCSNYFRASASTQNLCWLHSVGGGAFAVQVYSVSVPFFHALISIVGYHWLHLQWYLIILIHSFLTVMFLLSRFSYLPLCLWTLLPSVPWQLLWKNISMLYSSFFLRLKDDKSRRGL